MKVIDGEKYYTITEVASMIGKTRCTILRWYEYERNQPKGYEPILPQFIRMGGNRAIYFKESDLDKFELFRTTLKKGSMVDVSTKYNGTYKPN